MESLKKVFNLKSLFHGPLMWIAMAGMVLGTMSVYPDPTLLDWIIGVPMHMLNGAMQFIGAGGDPLLNIVQSTIGLDILPNHLGDMWNAAVSGGSHAGAAAAGHLHGAASFANEWDWFASLPDATRSGMINDAPFFGVSLDQYVKDWCTRSGVTLSP
ncbi:MAG: hypothetical protein LRY76_01975 [Alphaproteobacteria bacterium]|nr:hypothetical protein [Alphaproteobacteria bacterium]